MPHQSPPTAENSKQLAFTNVQIDGCTALSQRQLVQKLIYMIDQMREALLVTYHQKNLLTMSHPKITPPASSEIPELCERARILLTLAQELYHQ